MALECTHTGCFPALGTWALAGAAPWGYGPVTPRQAVETLDTTLELGCRDFDTAAMFGDGAVEVFLGQRLAGRSDVSVTTRVGVRSRNHHPLADFEPDGLREQVEASAERLMRVPDAVLLHTPPTGVLRHGQAIRALQRVRDAGLTRAIGASVFEPEEALMALATGVDWVCIPYNPLNRKAEFALFEAAARAGARVQVREVLHNGLLTDRPRDIGAVSPFDVRREWPPYLLERLAMARDTIRKTLEDRSVVASCMGYALGNEAISRVVAGCRGAQQVRDVFETPTPLSGAERQRLEEALYSSA
ncbi:MAG: aldo/keto reductase [Leptospirillia bacterium]